MSDLQVAIRSINKNINGSDELVLDNPESKTRKGTPYITITSGGVKEEGERFSAWFSTESKAVSRWFEEVIDFYNQKGGNIRWRSYPEIVKISRPSGFDYSIQGWYTVRSRVAFE